MKTLSMKRRDFEKILRKNGFVLNRSKGSHDIYKKGERHISIPHRTDINCMLMRRLIRENNLITGIPFFDDNN